MQHKNLDRGWIRLGVVHYDLQALIGTTLDSKYHITQLIGQGGMGAVYSAARVEDGSPVALKVIEDGELDEATIRRFKREGRAASTLENEHIVKVYETGRDEESGRMYMAMELLEGEDLQGLVERIGAIEVQAALAIVVQALEGLALAHEAGIIHRDIKPSNIFLARSEAGTITVKVLDFGIAKVMADPLQSAQSAGLTATGNLLGSPLYMSPEQVLSSRDVDVRTDVWSMGSTLYCALTGHAPHAAVDTIGRLLFTICSAPPPPLPTVAPWVDRDVAKVVQRSLEINREQRYSSAREMLQALTPLISPSFVLTSSTLVTVSEEARKQVIASVSATSAEFADTEEATARTLEAPESRDATPKKTNAIDTTSRTDPSSLARKWPFAVAAGSVCLGLIALLVMFGGSSPSSATNPASNAASASSSLAEAPVGKRVKLAIRPQDAEVEVDGRRVDVLAGGSIELVGSLGGVHRVRLRKGTSETTVEVYVTEAGAKPAEVVLDIGPEMKPVVVSSAAPSVDPDVKAAGASSAAPSAAPRRIDTPVTTSATKSTPTAVLPSVPPTQKPPPNDGIERRAE